MELLNFIITVAQGTKGSLLYGTDESHHNCFPISNNHKKNSTKGFIPVWY